MGDQGDAGGLGTFNLTKDAYTWVKSRIYVHRLPSLPCIGIQKHQATTKRYIVHHEAKIARAPSHPSIKEYPKS
jgi:hypothetical protein